MSEKLQTSQVARILEVNEMTVRKLADRGEFGIVEQHGGRRMYEPEAVEACRQRRKVTLLTR